MLIFWSHTLYMAFSKVYSGSIVGLDPYLLTVEVNIDYQGFPGFFIVGLASREIDEAKERVRSAIKNSGYAFPNRRITVNLAPADLPKKGSLYDLPIAIGILSAAGQINHPIENHFIMGELSLSGNVNRISGAIPLVIFANSLFSDICLPKENAKEASIIENANLKPVAKLCQLVDFLNQETEIQSCRISPLKRIINKYRKTGLFEVNFKDIKGQESVKRALEIACAGGHNASLFGPPGAGKTLLARSMISILPDITEEEALEVTKIYSIAGELDKKSPFIIERPFRTPHHSTSKPGLLGGGNPISPGEISLAHFGVLFIDEFPELGREIIESLRQPIENHEISISRAQGSLTFPSNFMLVIASNPCPCGNLGNPKKECTCYRVQIKKYQDKLSGPIIDRIDLHIRCSPVDLAKLSDNKDAEDSSVIKSRVQKARDLQQRRYKELAGVRCNADLDASNIAAFCALGLNEQNFMTSAANKLALSARSYHKILKVSRTISDLEENSEITVNHISEALQYRFSGFS